MCGRTACTLAPEEVCRACGVLTMGGDGGKQYTPASWHDHPGNHTYAPSYNVAPSRFTPVLVSERHLRGVKRCREGEAVGAKYVVQPMMWGLIPPFYKGSSATGHGIKTNNCRVEDVEEKKSYKPSLLKGQRCVVLCDGFYEWQTTKGDKDKQPFFIYAPQPEGVKIWDRETWDKNGVWSTDEGWKGPALLKIAGLFSQWLSDEGDTVYSYTVVTMESSGKFGELHHRVPAVLETQQQLEEWLDGGRVGYKAALGGLRSDTRLEWHPVTRAVNNSRNQDLNMNVPVSLEKKPVETASSKLMSSWLSKGPAKPSREAKVAAVVKKEKSSPLARWLVKEPKQEPSGEDSQQETKSKP